MKKKVIGLIPTRLGSTRLPQKALLEINNLPLIIHTYRRAKLSKLLDDVICCDDKKILNIANKFRQSNYNITKSQKRNRKNMRGISKVKQKI